MLKIICFILGTMMGSFFNVLICRLPKEESVVLPASHCPQCQHRLSWSELIPVLSYLLQRGQCSHCGQQISLQYPMVELTTGLIYVMLLMHYGMTVQFLNALLFISLLIPIIIIDLEHQIIPDSLNLTGAILGLLALSFNNITLLSALSGALVGGALMLLIAIVTKGGMGGGDVKMVAMMGIFLGINLTILALFVSFVIGGLICLLLIVSGIRNRKDFIPFGPFLASGGFIAHVYGQEIIRWYLRVAFN